MAIRKAKRDVLIQIKPLHKVITRIIETFVYTNLALRSRMLLLPDTFVLSKKQC